MDGYTATHVRLRKNGQTSQVAVFAPDDWTVVMIHIIEREPRSMADGAALIASFRVEAEGSPRPAAPEEPLDLDAFSIEHMGAARGAVDPEDLANVPRSEQPGTPSVANSCKTGLSECYETAHSAVGSGYYSNEKMCIGSFSTAPCPAEDRVGYCALSTTQLISAYKNDYQSLEGWRELCEQTYRGRWLGMPDERPWPRNE
jgi:hypothetical protein